MNIRWPWKKRNTFHKVADHRTFGTDLLHMLGLDDMRNVTYVKVEAFPPGRLPIVTIKCHPPAGGFEPITRQYELHERIVDNTVNND